MGAEYKPVDNRGKRWVIIWRQMYIGFTTLSYSFIYGMTLGAPTVVVDQFREKANSSSAVSDEMTSWLPTAIPGAAIFWAIVLIAMAHRYGRKKPAILVALTSSGGYLILYCSSTVVHVLYSQLIVAVSAAAATTVAIMMAIEYTAMKYRGSIMALKGASAAWGVWLANFIGAFFHYKYIALFGMACSVSSLIALIFTPESPYWLACQERYDECAAVHRWLNGSDDDAEKELETLLNLQKHLNGSKRRTKNSMAANITEYIKAVKKPELYKPFLVCALLVVSYYMSGKHILGVYAVQILKNINDDDSATYRVVLIVDGITVAGMYASSFVLKPLKKRLLYIGTCGICVLFLLMLALYLYLIRLSVIRYNTYEYLFVAMMIGYTLSDCAGPIATAKAIIGEIFPAKHRTFFISSYCILVKISQSVFVKVGFYIFRELEAHGAFLFFGIGLTVCITLAYKYLPETKDKTTQEIYEIFEVKHSNKFVDSQLLGTRKLTETD